MHTYITSIILSSLAVVVVTIVILLQAGLGQWGATKYGIISYSQRKRRADIPIIWAMSCLLFLNLSNIIGSSIWNGPEWYTKWNGHVYCDIVVHLQIITSTGIICGVIAISRNLCLIVSPQGPPPYFQTNKKRWIDLSICSILAIIQCGLIYLIQPSRYGIAQNIGCVLVVSNTWPQFLLYSLWIPILSTVAAGYALLSGYYCYKRKKDFNDILVCTNSGLSTMQFVRLWAFGFIVIGTMVPFSLYIVLSKSLNREIPGYSFAEVHRYFGVIAYFPYMAEQLLDRWMHATYSFIAFLLFGLGTEAQCAYMRILDALHLGGAVRSIGKHLKAGFYAITPEFIKKKIQNSKKNNDLDINLPPSFLKGTESSNPSLSKNKTRAKSSEVFEDVELGIRSDAMRSNKYDRYSPGDYDDISDHMSACYDYGSDNVYGDYKTKGVHEASQHIRISPSSSSGLAYLTRNSNNNISPTSDITFHTQYSPNNGEFDVSGCKLGIQMKSFEVASPDSVSTKFTLVNSPDSTYYPGNNNINNRDNEEHSNNNHTSQEGLRNSRVYYYPDDNSKDDDENANKNNSTKGNDK